VAPFGALVCGFFDIFGVGNGLHGRIVVDQVAASELLLDHVDFVGVF
jgi:hypothetical protein